MRCSLPPSLTMQDIALPTMPVFIAKSHNMSPVSHLLPRARSAPVTYTTLVIWVSVMISLVAICGCVALLMFIRHRTRHSRYISPSIFTFNVDILLLSILVA